MPFKFQLYVDLNTTMNYMHKHQDSRCIQELVSKTDDTICIKIYQIMELVHKLRSVDLGDDVG